MNATEPLLSPARFSVASLLAQLLQRIEHNPEPVGAGQYRSVVQHLLKELDALQSDPRLSAWLEAHPVAAELHENLNYQFAGLCRSPLAFSLQAELQARDMIARAMRRTGPIPGPA